MNLKRYARQWAVRWILRFFYNAMKAVIAWEVTMGKQDECKHENQTGEFCGLCGKQLRDEDETKLEETLERVLTKILNKPGGDGKSKKRTTLRDKLMGGSK